MNEALKISEVKRRPPILQTNYGKCLKPDIISSMTVFTDKALAIEVKDKYVFLRNLNGTETGVNKVCLE